jgi:hypothetical protein
MVANPRAVDWASKYGPIPLPVSVSSWRNVGVCLGVVDALSVAEDALNDPWGVRCMLARVVS